MTGDGGLDRDRSGVRGRGRLLVVGVGPGPGYTTGSGRTLIAEADVFVGGSFALSSAPAWGEKIRIAGSLEALLDGVETRMGEGQDVCVLTSGDPGYFSMLAALEERFPGEAIVEPGISSAQLLAARIGLQWHEMVHVSVHGREPVRELEGGLRRAGTGLPLAVLCDREYGPGEVARYLLDAGWAGYAAVGSRMGRPEESVEVRGLDEVLHREWPEPAVIFVLPQEWVEERGGAPTVRGSGDRPADIDVGDTPLSADEFCVRDDVFLRGDGAEGGGSPLSRWEVRAVLLAAASPSLRRVVWDVGAGSGGFSVELARANPDARVIAFEREPSACRLIRENAQRLGARVEVVEGEAPLTFPDEGPDLGVVGGSGGRLEEIIRELGERMDPGGRVIVSAVTLETVGGARDLLSAPPWTGLEVLQLSSARRDRAGIMKGANPVTLLWADRGETL